MAQVIRSAQVDEEPVLISYRRAEPEAPPPAPAVAEARTIAAVEPPPPAEDPRVALEALRRQAFEDGYRDGREHGEKEAKAELAQETERLQGLGASLRAALEQGIAGMEDAMVEIAFAAACKVLGQAAASEEGVRSMVQEAMRQVRSKEGLVLRVSPADYELLAARAPLAEGVKLELAADERVASGGCLIETSGGTLDARLEVQLRQLLETLARAREAQGE